jgi:hypothetical protein
VAVDCLVSQPRVPVAAGLGQVRARREDPRPADEPGGHRLRPGRLQAAGVADRREPLVQGALDERGHLQDVVDERLVSMVTVRTDDGEVNVGIGQAGEERAASAVHDGRPGVLLATWRLDGRDAALAHDDVVPPRRLAPGAVEDRDVTDDEVRRIGHARWMIRAQNAADQCRLPGVFVHPARPRVAERRAAG